MYYELFYNIFKINGKRTINLKVESFNNEKIAKTMDKKIITILIVALLVVAAGVIGFKVMRPEIPERIKPTMEEANVILAENLQNTLGLDSFRSVGDASFQIKDGETVVFGVTMEDMQVLMINPFNFTDQDSSMVITYDVVINFKAVADLIEAGTPPKDLEELKGMGELMGIDLLAKLRMIGEANISVVMEMKSINFDSYIKIVEVVGLREILMQVGGIFAAEMVMVGIEPYLGVWRKTPADPAMIEEMTETFEVIEKLTQSFLGIIYVREVLPNTRFNGIPVYNFATGINIGEAKDVVISFVALIAEKDEMGLLIEDVKAIEAGIVENWPKVKAVFEVIELDSRTYICQETRFTIRETGAVNINLVNLIATIDQIMREVEVEATPEEIADLERVKEALRGIRIVVTIDYVYSSHNIVPAIVPPAEYEIITPPERFRPPEPSMF